MLRQHQAKRRRSRSHHAPKQKQSIPYNAPSDLSSDLVVSSVLRDVATTASACALHTAQSAAGSEAEGGVARSTDFEVIDHGSQDAECSICLSKLDEKPATVIKMCNHVFHEDCILDWIGRSTADDPSCPLCQRSIPVERRGRSPTGTMTIQLSSSFCPGFPSGTTCIELIYDIPSGQQLPVSQFLVGVDRFVREVSSLTAFLNSFMTIQALGTKERVERHICPTPTTVAACCAVSSTHLLEVTRSRLARP